MNPKNSKALAEIKSPPLILPPGSQGGFQREKGLHLLARLGGGTSAGGTSARGAFAHPLEHVGEVPAGLAEAVAARRALASCWALRGWSAEAEQGKAAALKEPFRGGSSPSAGEQLRRWRLEKKKSTRKTSLGWKEQSPRGRMGRPRPGSHSVSALTALAAQQLPDEGQRARPLQSKSLEMGLGGRWPRLLTWFKTSCVSDFTCWRSSRGAKL